MKKSLVIMPGQTSSTKPTRAMFTLQTDFIEVRTTCRNKDFAGGVFIKMTTRKCGKALNCKTVVVQAFATSLKPPELRKRKSERE